MTKLKRFITPTALLAAFAFAASPSFAQEKYHGRRDGQPQPGAAAPAPRQDGRAQERAQPRGEAPRAQPRQEAQQPRQPQQQQQQQQRQVEQPRAQQQQQRQGESRAYDRRNDNNRGNDRRNDVGRAVPRGNVYAPHYAPRYSAPRYAPRYTPRGYGYYGTRTYVRPYVFRPRFSIGFGIYAGFPVPYAYSYPYPIEVYGYRAPRERVMITPNSPYYGGVVFEMSPYDADVFVDGSYAGRVEDFDGSQQPLTLTVGVHEIEVQAQGYEPMRVNVDVQPGQIIPYRGDLRPY